jgi:hypothetical protein
MEPLKIIGKQGGVCRSDGGNDIGDATMGRKGDDSIDDEDVPIGGRRRLSSKSVDGYEIRGQYFKNGVQEILLYDENRIKAAIRVEFDGRLLPPLGGRKTQMIWQLST